jgi:hypothetical protein
MLYLPEIRGRIISVATFDMALPIGVLCVAPPDSSEAVLRGFFSVEGVSVHAED